MKYTLLVTIVVTFLLGCNGGENKTNIELMQGMFDQISLKAQDWDPKRGGEASQLLPPEGTIPMNIKYYKYDDPNLAGEELKNPYVNENSLDFIKLGEEKYQIYCGVCHGTAGDAVGEVNGLTAVGSKMLIPPRSLVSDNVRNYPDGRIYHIIVKGQGLMGGYGSQLQKDEERWAIINFIRGLQKASR
jgi:hypothetical protein